MIHSGYISRIVNNLNPYGILALVLENILKNLILLKFFGVGERRYDLALTALRMGALT